MTATTLSPAPSSPDARQDATTIGLKGSPTNVYKSFAPPVKGAGMMVEGAAQLVGILNDKHLI